MPSWPFQFCYAVISLLLQVGPVIICLVFVGVACLENKWGYLVVSEKMCGPIIEVAFIAIKEEDLWVDLAIYTGLTEETHCLHLSIPVQIS